MNNEELKAARIAEAIRRFAEDPRERDDLEILADLYETNWTPPEPVPDDLLAARAYAKASGWAAAAVDAGSCDHTDEVVSFLAGCTRGREGAKGLVEDDQ